MRLKKTHETRISEKGQKVAINHQTIRKKQDSIGSMSRMNPTQYGEEGFRPEQWMGYSERKKWNSLSRRKQEKILQKIDQKMQNHPTKEMVQYAQLKAAEEQAAQNTAQAWQMESQPAVKPAKQGQGYNGTAALRTGSQGYVLQEDKDKDIKETETNQNPETDPTDKLSFSHLAQPTEADPLFPYRRRQYIEAKKIVKSYEAAADAKKALRIKSKVKAIKINDVRQLKMARLRKIPAGIKINRINRDKSGNRVPTRQEYKKALKYIAEYQQVQKVSREIYRKNIRNLALGATVKSVQVTGKTVAKEWQVLMKAKNQQASEEERQASPKDIGKAYGESRKVARRGGKVKDFVGNRRTTRKAVNAVTANLAKIPIMKPVIRFKMGDTAANLNALRQSPKRIVRIGARALGILKNAVGFATKSVAGIFAGFLPALLLGMLLISVVSAFSGAEAEGGSGNGMQIVEVAQQELSLSSQNVGGQKYKNWYGMNADWCAMFVSWCGNECGYITQGIMPKSAAVSGYMSWYLDKGLFEYKEGYTPKAGDFIVFKSAGASHIGIVVENSDGSTVKTIEGNSGGSNTSPYHLGSHVAAHSYSLDFAQITGYCTPAYPEEAGESVGPNAAFDDAPDAPADYNSGKYQQVTARLTAYCTCEICCGKWSGGPTASGVYPKQGQTIALDREAAQDLGLNFGARIAIDGKEFIYQDSGGSPMNDAYHQTGYLPIDVFFNNHADAHTFGVKVVPVYILSKS